MQSDDINCNEGKAAQYRADDLEAWRQFIDSRKIPSDELVIMAGDFNIHRDAPEFSKSLVNRLGVHPPDAYEGHSFTWDPVENSIAHSNYPTRKNGDYIDFVFVDKAHNNGVQSVVQTALKVHSPNYVLGRQTYGDFSDHFPVKAVINLSVPDPADALDTQEHPSPAQPQQQEQPQPGPSPPLPSSSSSSLSPSPFPVPQQE